MLQLTSVVLAVNPSLSRGCPLVFSVNKTNLKCESSFGYIFETHKTENVATINHKYPIRINGGMIGGEM